MSLRLLVASKWMSVSQKRRELKMIWTRTDAALDGLLSENGLQVASINYDGNDLEGMRAAMAKGHEQKVRALAGRIGEENAVGEARRALFKVGVELGREARDRLGVKGSNEDLVRSLKVMYNILGIEFTMADGEAGTMMSVVHCPLAREYSPLACHALSAVDEGAVIGLNPGLVMNFRDHNTGRNPNCVACIRARDVK